ncbi:MAG: hypothetical protein ACFCUQ_01070 [Kiloniellales bacterium]
MGYAATACLVEPFSSLAVIAVACASSNLLLGRLEIVQHIRLKAIFQPGRLISHAWRRIGVGPFRLRLAFDAVERPHYAYGMYNGALLASRLGYKKLSVIEFGVAGGNGLLAMERLAREVEMEWPVEIEIYGFDMGQGLPPPADYRDLPFEYQHGEFRMDEDKLRARLSRSQLVLGNVRDTVRRFLADFGPAPIGFVAIDLDFYSSTRDALTLFDADHRYLLPRVMCYFDDIVGADWVMFNEHLGELLAIKEFNETHQHRKLAPIHQLRHKRVIERVWNDKMYALHDFQHPRYNDHIRPKPAATVKLRG